MSGYLHFLNNLKNIKDHIYIERGLYLFPIANNSFQRKPQLIATLYILQ